MPTRARADYELRAVDKSRKGFDSFEGRLKRSSRLFESVSGKLFAGLGFGAALAGLTALAKSTVNAADRIGKLSTRLGVSAKALDFLRFAADRSGIGFDSVAKAIEKMQDSLGEVAAFGRGEAKTALEALGLDAKTLAREAPEKAFLEILKAVDKFDGGLKRKELLAKLASAKTVEARKALRAQLGDPRAERLTILRDIFGRGGADLLQLGGIGGLNNLANDFSRFAGGGITKSQVKNAEALKDALSNLDLAWDQLAQNMLSGTPKLTNAITELADALAFVDSNLDRIGEAWKFIGDLVSLPGRFGAELGRRAGGMIHDAVKGAVSPSVGPQLSGTITPTSHVVDPTTKLILVELRKQTAALTSGRPTVAVAGE